MSTACSPKKNVTRVSNNEFERDTHDLLKVQVQYDPEGLDFMKCIYVWRSRG